MKLSSLSKPSTAIYNSILHGNSRSRFASRVCLGPAIPKVLGKQEELGLACVCVIVVSVVLVLEAPGQHKALLV